MAKRKGGLGSLGMALALIGGVIALIQLILGILDQTIRVLENPVDAPGLGGSRQVGGDVIGFIVYLILVIILIIIAMGRLDIDEPIVLGIIIILFGWFIGGLGGLLALLGGILLILDGLF